MESVPEFLRQLEQRNGKEWMLVGMKFIRSVAIMHEVIQQHVDKKLSNGMDAEKLVGDSLARLLKLALGLGVLKKTQYDALSFLAKLRNRWAHARDIEMELGDIHPLKVILSQERKTMLSEHRDTLWGHFGYAVDLVCDQIHEDLGKSV